MAEPRHTKVESARLRFGPARCAIYTRKSTEDGLDQDFNSLDAQRDACEAYVLSQQGEGWQATATRYDDGGYSGGTMERPGLQQLLTDIRIGAVDIVVVYKVDRLTRSLSDFARLVEIFDAHGVSFVSITQQFNTTNSMGRLTLNVLLSFAQFEREVTAERIRDKIAASKKKGMWMGGNVPAGYRVEARALVPVEEEAGTVRTIFRLYDRLACVNAVRQELHRRGIVTPPRMTPSGRRSGGKPFSRGNLYLLLRNPLYIGKVRHRDQLFEGLHPALVEDALWQRVQARLSTNRANRAQKTNAKHPSLLTGLIFDDRGERLSPSHAVKQGKRYRYYISHSLMTGTAADTEQGWRLPATEIETAVIEQLIGFLRDGRQLFESLALEERPADTVSDIIERAEGVARRLEDPDERQRQDVLRALIERIEIGETRLKIALKADALGSPGLDPMGPLCLERPMTLRRKRGEARLVYGDALAAGGGPDLALDRTVVRARRWFERLTAEPPMTINDLARRDGVEASEISRALPLAFLAPGIVETILDGRQPLDLTAERLLRTDLPLGWDDQQRRLRIA